MAAARVWDGTRKPFIAMDYYCFSGDSSFCSKVKVMVSSFFGFLLCASTFRLPMQTHKHRPLAQPLPFSIPGLKTLIVSERDEEDNAPRVICSVGVAILRSKLLTRSSSCCAIGSRSLMDDWIGTESGVCLTSNAEEIEKKSTPSDSDRNYYHTKHQDQRRAAKKEFPFPPPIPFLASQAGHRTRPPWVLTRHHTDGRLILKLERVRHHQYLESHRENGRLILKLVATPVADGTEDDDQDLQFIEENGGNENKTDAEDMELIECEKAEAIEEATDSAMAFKSFTYGGEGIDGGTFCDRKPFCGVNGNLEERHVGHAYFGSAPLCPMGTVM